MFSDVLQKTSRSWRIAETGGLKKTVHLSMKLLRTVPANIVAQRIVRKVHGTPFMNGW